MKSVTGFLCVIIVLLNFAACRKETAKEGELEITFRVTEKSQIEVYTKIFNSFIEAYNAEKGTNLILKITPGQGMDITNTRMSSNDKPDIFMLDGPADVVQYAGDGLLYDLTKTAEKGRWSEKLFDWAYNLSKTDGKVYTLPYGYEGMVLWYNKTIMKELGLDAASIDTLAEFEAALQAAKDANYTPIMLGTQDWPWAQEWYLSILFSYTGKEQLKKTLSGTDGGDWRDQAYAKTVGLYKSWHQKGYLADGKSYVLTSGDAINAFSTDKALFKLEGTWAPYWITPLEKADKDKIGVMLHPAINETETPHMPLAVGGMWCAANDSEHAEAAAYIINKLLDENIQGQFIKAGLDVAPIAIDRSQFQGLDPVVEQMWSMVNGALDQGNYGYTTWAFYPPKTRVYLYEGIVNVLEGTIPVDKYLSEAQKLNRKEIEEGFAPILP